MKKAHTRIFARMAFYLLFALGGLCVAGLLPYRWASSLVSAVFMLLPLLLERLALGGIAPPRLTLKSAYAPLLLSPFLFSSVYATATLTGLLLQLLRLPTAMPDISLDAEGVLVAVLVAPIAEELFCRHLLLGLCRRISPSGGGCILLSSLLFALLHANFYQIPYALVAGAFLSAAAMMTGSPLLPILLHMGVNLLSLLTSLPLLAAILIPLLWLLSLIGLCIAFKRTGRGHYAEILTAWRDKDGRRALVRGALLSPVTAVAVLCFVLAIFRIM